MPDSIVRWCARRSLRRRLRRVRPDSRRTPQERGSLTLDTVSDRPIFAAGPTALARADLPVEFWKRILGAHFHAGTAFWPRWAQDIDLAELEWLELVAGRADLGDGQHLLEVGCHLGSVGRWAEHELPGIHTTLLGLDSPNRSLLEHALRATGPASARIANETLAQFDPTERYDRILFIEGLGGVSNPAPLLGRMVGWLKPGGMLFVQIACHWRDSYVLEPGGEHQWMAPDVACGALWPGEELLRALLADLPLRDRWELSGEHTERTARAWSRRLSARRSELLGVLSAAGSSRPERILRRWRNALLAQQAQFGFRKGQEWCVTQLLLG